MRIMSEDAAAASRVRRHVFSVFSAFLVAVAVACGSLPAEGSVEIAANPISPDGMFTASGEIGISPRRSMFNSPISMPIR